MNKKFNQQLLPTLLFVYSTTSAANAMENNLEQYSLFHDIQKTSWVSTLSVGPVWERAGRTQTFYLTPSIEKTYTYNNNLHSLIDGEIFFGIQKKLNDKLNSQFGFTVATTSNAAISGVVWDDADPTFNNYIYDYQIRHTHIAVKGKLLNDLGYVFTPWINASMGLGFNQASDFSNTPTISEAIMMPNFASNTTTSFTYTVGAGVQRQLNQNWHAGIGYEFADWGNSHLGRSYQQTLNQKLSLSHLYTNGLLLSLTYLS